MVALPKRLQNMWPFKKQAPPLHRALENTDGLQVNEHAFLVEELATKRRCKKKDSFERLALHVACQNQPDIDTVMLLIDVYPKAIRVPDKLGRLPLHAACANRASLEVIEYLWRQDPETVFEVTDRGVSCLWLAGAMCVVSCEFSHLFIITPISYSLDRAHHCIVPLKTRRLWM